MTIWLDTGSDYKVGVREGKVIALNKAGKELKTVPAKLKDNEATANLRDLLEWLAGHEREVAAQINGWMVQSLPVTTELLRQVWSDESWRTALTDLVLVPSSSTGVPAPGAGPSGFLRSADATSGVGLVTLDGESEVLESEHFLIAHPIDLGEDLDDYRAFAAELGVVQNTAQLMRETFTIGERDPESTSVADYAGGEFEALQHATSRARTLGYVVKGGFAVCNLSSHGAPVQASYWVGSGDPQYETSTGELNWVSGGTPLALKDVGAAAFSEGMRMASAIYAGRKVETGDDAA